MKKGISLGVLVIIVILFFISIWYLFKSDRKEVNKWQQTTEPQIIEGVSMIIKDGTLTKSSATVIITDTVKDEEHTYGDSFAIQKKRSNEWIDLDTIIDNYGFNMIGYGVNEDNILEMEVKWDWLYGELEKGEYRLIKNFAVNKNDSYLGSKKIYVEFTIV